MIPSGACPGGVDLEDPSQVAPIYTRFLTEYTQAYRDSLVVSSSSELNAHLQSDYGTTNYLAVVGIWAANPTDPLLTTGAWGYGHAALSVQELQIMQATGSTDAEIIARGEELKAHYFVREAIARCRGLGTQQGAVVDWLNPASWYEDSRLDYYTPLLFIDWFIGGL